MLFKYIYTWVDCGMPDVRMMFVAERTKGGIFILQMYCYGNIFYYITAISIYKMVDSVVNVSFVDFCWIMETKGLIHKLNIYMHIYIWPPG